MRPKEVRMTALDNPLSKRTMVSNRVLAANDESEATMRHPSTVWADPIYEQESLVRLKDEYLEYLRGRAEQASQETIEKYRKSIASFLRSLDRHQEPLELGSLTPSNVNRWVTDQRKEGLSEDGIASRLSAVKVFAKKYICEHLELTHGDLLRKVPRITPPAKPMPALTEQERDAILNCFSRMNFEDHRNKAFIGCYLATGLRFREVLEIELPKLDRVSGEVLVRTKGGRERLVRLSPKALRFIKEYLRFRPKGDTQRLWVTEEGNPLTYWGGQSIFRRLKERSGVKKLHAHLLRHTFAQHALLKGAERQAVQDMLGHRSDAMARRYAGSIREETAAKMMPEFSPL